MKKFVVQKFGGTSVGFPDRLKSLTEIVTNYSAHFTPIIVVSAVSGYSKTEGTTSQLLQAIDKACSKENYHLCIDSIKAQHQRLIDLLPEAYQTSFLTTLNVELETLSTFLEALTTIGEKSARSIDYVLSFGERLSAALVSEVLRAHGIKSRMTDLSNVITEDFDVSEEDFYDRLSSRIVTKIEPCHGEISVATGFFGFVPDGILNRVGRGYSDLTAALIARGLGESLVEELQIWKEVDGVFSADPRKVSSAKVLTEISASEAVELTFFGSEVIHPHTMEQVTSKNIPIRVLNSLKPLAVGTIIRKEVVGKSASPVAVTVKKGVIVLSLTSNRMYDAKGFLAQIFDILKEEDLVVDLVSTSEVNVSCTVNNLEKLNRARPRLEKLGIVNVLENRAILAVVGKGLSSETNTIGKMFTTLSKMKVKPEMITQAESRTSISCVIHESEVESALDLVHNAIFL